MDASIAAAKDCFKGVNYVQGYRRSQKKSQIGQES